MNRRMSREKWQQGRGTVVVGILMAALIGFEIFNFDTTRFALMDLMSGHHFLGIEWAAILAFAFCSIDFAGLVRMFTPEQTLQEEPKEVWLLMGAWLLGATLNAVMTWYAVLLTLVPRNVGTVVMSRENILFFAPIFVATLVWLTRILIIGSGAVAADRALHGQRGQVRAVRQRSRVRPNGRSIPVEDVFSEEL